MWRSVLLERSTGLETQTYSKIAYRDTSQSTLLCQNGSGGKRKSTKEEELANSVQCGIKPDQGQSEYYSVDTAQLTHV